MSFLEIDINSVPRADLDKYDVVELDEGPDTGFYAVISGQEIIALFVNENAACQYRLMLAAKIVQDFTAS